MRRPAVDLEQGVTTQSLAPSRHLHLVEEAVDEPQVSFSARVASYVTNRCFQDTLAEIGRFDELTIGPAEAHAADIREQVMFGSGVVMIVSKHSKPKTPGTQPETLDITV